jgi:hypothetical protein
MGTLIYSEVHPALYSRPESCKIGQSSFCKAGEFCKLPSERLHDLSARQPVSLPGGQVSAKDSGEVK